MTDPRPQIGDDDHVSFFDGTLADGLDEPRFRPATLFDAELLYRWRVADERTVDYASPTTFEAHLIWLSERTGSPAVQLLIWEEDGQPAGTVRIDSNGELAFHAVDDEVAVRMLRAALVYADEYGGRLKVTLDAHDTKSVQLKQVGFRQYPAKSLIYRR